MFKFFGRFTYVEFIAIWTASIFVIVFYILLLYNFFQINKGTNSMVRNLKRLLDLLPAEEVDN